MTASAIDPGGGRRNPRFANVDPSRIELERRHSLLSRQNATFKKSLSTLLELTHGAQEIHLAEGGPKNIGKIELAVGTLPQQKTRQDKSRRSS